MKIKNKLTPTDTKQGITLKDQGESQVPETRVELLIEALIKLTYGGKLKWQSVQEIGKSAFTSKYNNRTLTLYDNKLVICGFVLEGNKTVELFKLVSQLFVPTKVKEFIDEVLDKEKED